MGVEPDPRPLRRWAHVGVAAVAMVATLPGRTHGLGLFTEPILRTFDLGREAFGVINLWATLAGALFCLPCGWLLDRLGPRVVLASVMAGLAATVVGMSAWAGGVVGLAVLILLTRGLGQSALSVASLAFIGRAAGTRAGLTMGVYSCLVTLGFIAAFGVLREVVKVNPDEWRTPWAGIGVGVLAAAVVTWPLAGGGVRGRGDTAVSLGGATLAEALRSRAFWAFAVGTSYYGMVAAGTSLFNESILAERGLPKEVFLNVTLVGIPVGLIANLLCGWLATRWPLGRLCGGALVLFAVGLAAYPFIVEEWHAYAYASVLAAAGGVVTVCFFTVWRREYGLAALGRIQGAAQLLTVVFSAAGPLLFASAKTRLEAYAPLFVALAAGSVALGALCWFTRVRAPSEGDAR